MPLAIPKANLTLRDSDGWSHDTSPRLRLDSLGYCAVDVSWCDHQQLTITFLYRREIWVRSVCEAGT